VDASDWDERYRRTRDGDAARLWSPVPARVVQATVAPWKPGRALDLATGDGRTAIWLARQGWSVTALDFSAEAIGLAREHARAEHVDVDWLVADATLWSPGALFDLVTVMYLHLPEEILLRVLTDAAGWVAPGGHLLVLGHDRRNIDIGAPGPADPSILYTPELLRSVVAPARVLRCETIERDLAADPEAIGDRDGQLHEHGLDTLLVASAGLVARADTGRY